MPTPRPDQQPEPVIEAVPHLGRRHRGHAGGGQFDRQRDAVEPRQISTTAAASSAVATEKRAATLRARSTNRVTAAESMPARTSERGHQPQLLVGDPQSFPAGGQNPHRRRVRQDRLDQIRRSVTHVLAVVEHQQPHPALQRGGHTLSHGLTRLLSDTQHRCHRVGHRRRISDRGQLENPDTVRKLIGQARRNFGRQAGLADPAHPGQRHQSMSLQRLFAPRPVLLRVR